MYSFTGYKFISLLLLMLLRSVQQGSTQRNGHCETSVKPILAIQDASGFFKHLCTEGKLRSSFTFDPVQF